MTKGKDVLSITAIVALTLLGILALCGGGLWVVRTIVPRYAFETKTRFFQNLDEASELKALGRLPDNLPATSIEIYEKFDGSGNTGMLALRFDPQEFGSWATNLSEIPQAQLDTVVTRWLPTPERWFESAIRKRRFEKLINRGFRFYECYWDDSPEIATTPVMKSVSKMYVVVNPTNGIAYIWSFQIGTEEEQRFRSSTKISPGPASRQAD